MRKLHAMVLVLGLAGLSFATHANAIVYDMKWSAGNATATGFIETDGTLGVLSVSNIVDFMITLTAPDLFAPNPTVLSGSGIADIRIFDGNPLSATQDNLVYNFEVDGAVIIQGTSNFLCFEGLNSTCSGSGARTSSIGFPITGNVTNHSGTANIAFARVAPVPLPASLSFGLLGAACLGCMGRRRTA